MKKTTIASAAVAALLALPGVASAHVTVSPSEAPAGGYATLMFQVPHGCDGSPTTRLTIKIPGQVTSAKPQEVAGWKVGVKQGKLAKPIISEGQKVTEGVKEVSWTGGPLPDDHMQLFGLSVGFAGKPGQEVGFKALQDCANGEQTAWIQNTPPGGDEPEHPTPTVTLTADAASGSDAATGEPASASAGGGDSGSDTLAIIALIVGGIGLLAGGGALVSARRS